MSDAPSIATIDGHYGGPGLAAVYLIPEPGHAAFVDTNTTKSLPYLLEGLHERGLDEDEVGYVIVTHVHLDHSGGTAALLARCPNATVLCHPRSVRHLVDPARLVASSKQVYGNEAFNELYGTIEAVAPERVRPVADGETLTLGDRRLTFLHTEGHARHHICVHDHGTNGLITGDAFGLALTDLDDGGAAYVVCSSSPTDFDAEAARATADRLVATGATRAHVTHFGTVHDLSNAREQFVDSVDRMERVSLDLRDVEMSGPDLLSYAQARVAATLAEHAQQYGSRHAEEIRRHFEKDYWLNAMGLAYLEERRRRREGTRQT